MVLCGVFMLLAQSPSDKSEFNRSAAMVYLAQSQSSKNEKQKHALIEQAYNHMQEALISDPYDSKSWIYMSYIAAKKEQHMGRAHEAMRIAEMIAPHEHKVHQAHLEKILLTLE